MYKSNTEQPVNCSNFLNPCKIGEYKTNLTNVANRKCGIIANETNIPQEFT